MVMDAKTKRCLLCVPIYPLQAVKFGIQLVCKVFETCHFHEPTVTSKMVPKAWNKSNHHHCTKIAAAPITTNAHTSTAHTI